jgi:DNA polymerase type B, organellar and viral
LPYLALSGLCEAASKGARLRAKVRGCEQRFEGASKGKDFLEFGEYKVIIVNGKIKNDTFNLHHNILIKNDTTFYDYWNKIEDILENVYEEGYAMEGIPLIEINVWNMDLYANKKIKITRNAVTGEELLTITNKQPIKNSGFNLGKKFYSTKSNNGIPLVEGYNNSKKTNDKYLSYITPIKQPKSLAEVVSLRGQDKKSFSAMDIETIDFKGKELPVSISIKTRNITKIFTIDKCCKFKPCFRPSFKPYFKPCTKPCYKPYFTPRFIPNTTRCRFCNKSSLTRSKVNILVTDLWDKFFDFMLSNCNKDTIFVHNLGGFYGFFIYKALSNRFKPEEVSCLIDSHNKFIQITLEIDKLKIVFKDSYRIFPVSLNDLCNILGLPGKSSSYNPKFHKITLFNNKQLLHNFKEYSLQDSISLFDCIYKLQEMYLTNYNVDITTILSTSTLSMKIFRSKFLNVDIPILKRLDDTFIRKSYFGGATDYYKLKAENLHYYDVNSLYPFSMMKPMPFKLLRKIIFKDNSGFNLNNFFGFLKVEVTCPKDVKVPVLPGKFKGKTIFPTGC